MGPQRFTDPLPQAVPIIVLFGYCLRRRHIVESVPDSHHYDVLTGRHDLPLVGLRKSG